MDENERPSEMPQNIGRYQVLESVGFGAMGAVYKAFDPLIKRTLAIKTIRLDIPRQSPQYRSFIDRFYHEARISGTLSHPNIVTLFDIGEENGLPYLAMEFVEGETIMSLIEKGTRFKPEKVIGLVSQMASAIDYAHSKGVIHRDIKPSNVILYGDERVKVTDFGIAKLVDAEMTQSGQLLGTPSYMSPEQAMGEKLDGRSDIFSLGVCAFEMLSGEQPFPGSNVTAILYKLVHVDPIEPANLEMHGLVPQKWHEVFSRVLAKKPDDRYQTATEFVQDLEFCLGSWFGAVPDMTLNEPMAAAAAPDKEAEEPVEVTVAMRTPSFEEPAPPSEDKALPTVFMSARELNQAGQPSEKSEPPPADMEGTVVMPAGGTRTAAAPAPVPPVDMEGTVVLPTPAPERAPAQPPPAPQPEAEGTLLMAAPPAPAASPRSAPAEVEGTVLIASPYTGAPEPAAPAAAAAKQHYGPPATGGEVEGTVVMQAPPPARPLPPPIPLRAAAPVPPMPPAPIKPTMPLPPPIPQVAEAAAEPGTAVRRGVPIALIAGGAGLLLLLGAVGIGVLLMNRGGSEPTPAPSVAATAAPTAPPTTQATAPVEGTLHVETEPAGATVTVDGVVRGTSPVDVTGLAPGAHEVKIEQAGFADDVQTVEISTDAPAAVLKVSLSKAGPVMGAADFTTNPAGALVKVDGTSVGRTPLRNHRLRVGGHRVELTADGYEPWSGRFSVREGRRAKVDIFLKAIPKATPVPTPTPEVVDPNRVYEANQVDVAPRKVSGGAAAYPRGAPRLRGAVTVSGTALVTADGDVADVTITGSGGSAVDAAVVAAVRNWKFSPGVKKGVKVKVRVPFRQTFLPG